METRIDVSQEKPLSETSRAVVAAFFTEPNDSAVYAYVDKDSGSVHVRNVAPVACDTPVQYFFKDSDAAAWNPAQGIPEVQQLAQSIFFGYLRTEDLAEDVTSLVGQLCLPQVCVCV